MKIPRTWEAWIKTLLAGSIGSAAQAGLTAMGIGGANMVGIKIAPMDLHQLGAMMLSGAIVGGLLFLAKSPMPPDSPPDQPSK